MISIDLKLVIHSSNSVDLQTAHFLPMKDRACEGKNTDLNEKHNDTTNLRPGIATTTCNSLNSNSFDLVDYLHNIISENIKKQTEIEKNANNEVNIKNTPPNVSRKLIVTEADDEVYTFLNKPDNGYNTNEKPWKEHPYYFQSVNVSMLAMMKMTMHAISGGSIEIMGMLVGYYRGNQLYVLDCYPLPVHGTESRVNPQNDSYEFMLKYLTKLQQSKIKKEHIIGWYHSHPGFGCWLSGIDVQTQQLHQGFEDPYLAIVIDPIKSIQNGTIDIGAFRTFHNNVEHKMKKDDSMGWHAKDYYSLDVKMFVNHYDKLLLSSINQSDASYSALTLSNSGQSNEEALQVDLKENVNGNTGNTYDSIKVLRKLNSTLCDLKLTPKKRLRRNISNPEIQYQENHLSNNFNFPNNSDKKKMHESSAGDTSEPYDQVSYSEIEENENLHENTIRVSQFFKTDATTAFTDSIKTDDKLINDEACERYSELLNLSLALEIDTSSQLQNLLIQEVQRELFR